METRPLTPMPSPPLPMRNPNRHRHPLSMPLPPPPDSLDMSDLMPPPLFTKRTRSSSSSSSTFYKPASTSSVTERPISIYPIPSLPPPLSLSSPFRPTTRNYPPPSPTSLRSASSRLSTPSSSPPSSPSSRPRSLTYSPTPSYCASLIWETESNASQQQQHTLRRKKSPKRQTLRALRAKESDACLQRVYDERTSAYLDGLLIGSFGAGRGGLEDLGEE